MINRGQGFFAVICFGSSPTPFSLLQSAICLSFPVFLFVTARATDGRRGRGEASSQIIRPQESPHKSFNTLWFTCTAWFVCTGTVNTVFIIYLLYNIHCTYFLLHHYTGTQLYLAEEGCRSDFNKYGTCCKRLSVLCCDSKLTLSYIVFSV